MAQRSWGVSDQAQLDKGKYLIIKQPDPWDQIFLKSPNYSFVPFVDLFEYLVII